MGEQCFFQGFNNDNFLHQLKKGFTGVSSAVTPLLFEVTIILSQKNVKLSYSEFQHSKNDRESR